MGSAAARGAPVEQSRYQGARSAHDTRGEVSQGQLRRQGTREAGTGPGRYEEPRGFLLLLFCCKCRSRSQPRSPGDQEAPAAVEGSRRVRIKEQRGTTCRARPGGGVQARRRRKLPPGTRFPRSPAAGRGLAPRGKQRAPRSLGATTVAPGRSGAGSRPAPSSAGVTAPASGKPLRGRRSKQHRRGAGAPGRRRHSGRPGWVAAPSLSLPLARSLPPASAVPALLPALPPRRRVPCPSLQGHRPVEPPQTPAVGRASCGKPKGASPGHRASRSAPQDQTKPRCSPPPPPPRAPPHRPPPPPQPPRRRRRHNPARGSSDRPPPSAPASTPPPRPPAAATRTLESASPTRPLRALLPPRAPPGRRHRQSPQRLSNRAGYLYSPAALGPPAARLLRSRIPPSPPRPTSPEPACSGGHARHSSRSASPGTSPTPPRRARCVAAAGRARGDGRAARAPAAGPGRHAHPLLGSTLGCLLSPLIPPPSQLGVPFPGLRVTAPH